MGWITLRVKLVRIAMEAYELDRKVWAANPPQTVTWKVDPTPLSEEDRRQRITPIIHVEVTPYPGYKPWNPVASMEKYVDTLLIRRPR
jgi:hypothetical protein